MVHTGKALNLSYTKTISTGPYVLTARCARSSAVSASTAGEPAEALPFSPVEGLQRLFHKGSPSPLKLAQLIGRHTDKLGTNRTD